MIGPLVVEETAICLWKCIKSTNELTHTNTNTHTHTPLLLLLLLLPLLFFWSFAMPLPFASKLFVFDLAPFLSFSLFFPSLSCHSKSCCLVTSRVPWVRNGDGLASGGFESLVTARRVPVFELDHVEVRPLLDFDSKRRDEHCLAAVDFAR